MANADRHSLDNLTLESEDGRSEIETRFTYHPPKGGQAAIYDGLRQAGKALAETIIEYAPSCRERSLAVTKLEEAIMWANAAVARRS